MSSNDRTLHCECGCETYHIHWTFEGDIWAECSECGRPTSMVGTGMDEQREWYLREENRNE